MSLPTPNFPQLRRRLAGADTIPASPPAEVLDAIDAAWDAYDRLEATGHRLHFASNPRSGRLTVELHDLKDNILGTVPLAKALDVATGTTLD
jgi:flagellar protein FlaG